MTRYKPLRKLSVGYRKSLFNDVRSISTSSKYCLGFTVCLYSILNYGIMQCTLVTLRTFLQRLVDQVTCTMVHTDPETSQKRKMVYEEGGNKESYLEVISKIPMKHKCKTNKFYF